MELKTKEIMEEVMKEFLSEYQSEEFEVGEDIIDFQEMIQRLSEKLDQYAMDIDKDFYWTKELIMNERGLIFSLMDPVCEKQKECSCSNGCTQCLLGGF